MATTHPKRSTSDLAGEVTEGQRAMAAWMTAATGEVLTINTSLLANDHDLNRGMVQWAKVIAISAGVSILRRRQVNGEKMARALNAIGRGGQLTVSTS